MSGAKKIGAYTFVAAELEGLGANDLRSAGDVLKDKDDDIVAILASEADGKLGICVVCGKNAVKNGANAGKLVKTVATICGGGGGGRPDSAFAGGKDKSKLAEAFAEAEKSL